MTAYLVATDAIEIWHLFLLEPLLGIPLGLSNSAGRTIVFDLVGRDLMIRARAVITSSQTIANFVGSAIGGILIAQFGNAAIFWMLTGIYVVSWLMFFAVPRDRETAPASGASGWLSVLTQLREGFVYARRTPTIRWLLIMVSGVMFHGVTLTFFPIFARDLLEVGPQGFGYLISSMAVGSLTASVVLFKAGDFRGKGKIAIAGGTAMPILVIGFAFSNSFLLSLILGAITGALVGSYFSLVVTLLLTTAREDMRGRVQGLAIMLIQTIGIGFLLGGVLTELFDSREAMFIAHSFSLALWVLMLIKAKEVHRL